MTNKFYSMIVTKEAIEQVIDSKVLVSDYDIHSINFLPEEIEQFDSFTIHELDWLIETLFTLMVDDGQSTPYFTLAFVSRWGTLSTNQFIHRNRLTKKIAEYPMLKQQYLDEAKRDLLDFLHSTNPVILNLRLFRDSLEFGLRISKLKDDWFWLQHDVYHSSREYREITPRPEYYKCDGFRGLKKLIGDLYQKL